MLAARMEQGETLTTILHHSSGWLPPHVAGLIVAALRTGRLGEALLDLVEHQREARSLRGGIWQAVLYPITVGILALVLFVLLMTFLSGTFESMFRGFDLRLPLATRHLFWWRDTGIWLVAGGLAIAVGMAVVYRRRRGAAMWTRLLESIPLFGPLLHFRGMAEWSSLMNVLIKNQVPLPDALRWSAEGISNAWVAHNARIWANESASGRGIADVLASQTDFPHGLAPLIQWGEKNGVLAEAFATSREVLERRVRLRTELLRTALPPLLFLAIGCSLLMLVTGLFFPIITLINGLS
jgi:type II secretory pathway component PulF